MTSDRTAAICGKRAVSCPDKPWIMPLPAAHQRGAAAKQHSERLHVVVRHLGRGDSGRRQLRREGMACKSTRNVSQP